MNAEGSAERREARERYLTSLLTPRGVTLGDLEAGTQDALHEYARFILSHGHVPSAGWNPAINELTRAVDFEVIAVLGDVPGLENLDQCTTGQKGHALRDFDKSRGASSVLSRRRLLPTYVLGTLPELLLDLAKIRKRSGSAHGSKKGRKATPRDHDEFLEIAIRRPDAVIPTLAKLRKGISSRARP